MAQADGVVANGTGSAVRADINGQLAALFTNHSGSTEPATTFAFQTWADTNTSTLKLRNSSNDGWIQLARLDGQFDAKTFNGNITLNAQSDLRLADSDSSNWVAFQAPATVASNVTWTLPAADGTSGQTLQTNGSGTLSWSTPSVTVDIIEEGNTSAEVVDTGSDGHFKVITEGTEALRINNSQRVGIGDTDFDALLSIKGAADLNTTPHLRLKDGTDTREAWIANNAGDLQLANGGNDNTPHCFVKLLDGNQIQLGTANTERFRVGSSGELGIGGGTYGTSGQVLTSQGSGSAPQWADAASAPSFASICDQKAVNTYGGNSVSNAWTTRDLNTELYDPDSIVSISSNQFTLGAGTYTLIATAPFYRTEETLLRIANVSDTVYYTSQDYNRNSTYVQSILTVVASFTIASSKTFAVQYRCGGETFGLGVAQAWQNNIYTKVEILKFA